MIVSISQVQLAIEIGSSFGMLLLTLGAIFYILKAKNRV